MLNQKRNNYISAKQEIATQNALFANSAGDSARLTRAKAFTLFNYSRLALITEMRRTWEYLYDTPFRRPKKS